MRAVLSRRLSWSDFCRPFGILRAHWLTISFVLCLINAAWYVYSSMSKENPVRDDLPGFFHGTYVSSWEEEPGRYDLYFPPQFHDEEGPFPLIVFLAGYGERHGN